MVAAHQKSEAVRTRSDIGMEQVERGRPRLMRFTPIAAISADRSGPAVAAPTTMFTGFGRRPSGRPDGRDRIEVGQSEARRARRAPASAKADEAGG